MRKLLTICLVVTFVLLTTTAQASLITSVVRTNGDPSTPGLPQIIPGPSPAGLQEGSPPYVDRQVPPDKDYIWQNVPAPLLGADYVMTYCYDKRRGVVDVSYIVTLSGDATLCIIIDDRYMAGTRWRDPPYEPLFDPPFPWLTDNSAGAVFTDTGLRLSHTGYDSSSNGYYEGKLWVYSANVSAGAYTLGPTVGYEPYISSRTFYGIAAVAKIVVEIDIKPGSYPNSINPNAGGVIPVAILTTEDFDASTVEPETVALEGVGARGKGKSGRYGSMEDVDDDGDLDLVVQIENTIAWAEDAVQATLTGKTYYGFGMQGTDTVNIVPPE